MHPGVSMITESRYGGGFSPEDPNQNLALTNTQRKLLFTILLIMCST